MLQCVLPEPFATQALRNVGSANCPEDIPGGLFTANLCQSADPTFPQGVNKILIKKCRKARPVKKIIDPHIEPMPCCRLARPGRAGEPGHRPGEVALGASMAKRDAEAVLRSLANMGLPPDRVTLSATTSATAQTNEVHIYVR